MINKKRKILISMTIALALIFSITYYLSDRYITNTKTMSNQTGKTTEVNADKSILDDNIKVSLFAGEKKENVSTVADLKKELNINGDITQSELVNVLKDKGYNLDLASNGEVIFKKEAMESLEPNKYYIGEKDGFLAIYKTDSDGKLLIEDSKDVFLGDKKVESLREDDKNKIENFQFKYNSKEEAEEGLSEFLS